MRGDILSFTRLWLLFAAGKIPIIGPMKKAYRMMKEKGIQMGDIKGSDEEADAEEEEDFDENNERTKHVSVLNLILPLVCIDRIFICNAGLTDDFRVCAVYRGWLYRHG